MILMSKMLAREMKFRMDIAITATDTAKLMIRVKSTIPLSCSFSIAARVTGSISAVPVATPGEGNEAAGVLEAAAGVLLAFAGDGAGTGAGAGAGALAVSQEGASSSP